MLRFKLQQIYVPSLGRYLLPLPKLGEPQLKLVSAHLEARGFSVRRGSASDRRIAMKGTQRIHVEGSLGIASSSEDMLDALAPTIPLLLSTRKQGTSRDMADLTASYFSVKRSGAKAVLQVFPRAESLRTWTCLRMDGLCALTPDEAVALKRALAKAPNSSLVRCVTERPREGSTSFQVGKRLYYRSALPASEFVSSLRTVGSEGPEKATYLPRDSVLEVPGVEVQALISLEELGEWCLLG